MISVVDYLGCDDDQRDLARVAASEEATGIAGRAARLYAAEAIIALKREIREASVIHFRTYMNVISYMPAVEVVEVFDDAGRSIWESGDAELDSDSTICDYLARAVDLCADALASVDDGAFPDAEYAVAESEFA
jgi:hypothetical protein